MCSGVGDWTCLQPGFPIRKSSNHSSAASSSRLIAGSYVLHRLLVPRHPPCALKNLTTDNKMLASTVQFSSYGRIPAPCSAPTRRDSGGSAVGAGPTPEVRRPREEGSAPVPSGPNSVPGRLLRRVRSDPANRMYWQTSRTDGQLVDVPPLSNHPEANARVVALDARRRQVLLRKEVIQPHLPVRLPCYDFVPIASPTFDGSLHKGWATGFGCYRLS